jgi:hypothetical protein
MKVQTQITIELKFRDAAGNLFSVMIDGADSGLYPEDVRAAADAIISVNAFQPTGYPPAALVSAIVTEKTATELEV